MDFVMADIGNESYSTNPRKVYAIFSQRTRGGLIEPKSREPRSPSCGTSKIQISILS